MKSTAFIFAMWLAGLNLLGFDEPDIPAGPPQDSVMATAEETQAALDWAYLAFGGPWANVVPPQISVQVRRQDHAVLQFGRSCIETPMRIGRQSFSKGLGTHAASELVLELPPGAKTFKAQIGVDNNPDTEGKRGTVVFSVAASDQELFRSPICRGGAEPVAVNVPLPPGTRQIILKTDPTADGASHDQADWADAAVELADGTICRADDERPGLLERALPFSFLYDGQPSAGFLADWTQSHTNTDRATRRIHQATWQDPKTGLRVTAEVTVFKPYAVVEWVLYFENTGTQDTAVLANIKALDTRVRTGYARKPLKLHQIIGDQVNERSFLPFETILEPGKPALVLRPEGGRSSNHTFPFFNLQYGGDEGLMVAVGWSGQWAATLERSAAGPTHLTAGMEKTRIQLHPGERIRTPRILLLPWKGELQASHNRLRRLLLFEYAPRQDGRPTQLPVALQCFDRYSWTVPDFGSEAGQLRAARATRDFGFNTHWLDAAWFEGGFPNGVGNWFCKPKAFPAGLQPVGDACHQMGLKFLVWFEPERVAPGTQIAREHPEFVFGGAKGGLFNLGNPQARQWLTDLVAQRIKEFGIDCYRNDFNMDPLASWNGADATNPQGMAEIRYVEGHYAFWDELRRRTPGLFIDNCASGGRRIDLETCARAVPLWRSDTGCQPGRADWEQNQTLGLGRFVPLFASCAWEPKAYVLRSAASAGIICQFDYLNEKFPADEARRAVAEARANRKYWYGDFYPLTSAGLNAEAWAAWQLHRADLDAGIVLAFRREDSPFPVMQTVLRALKPSGRYRVVFIDEERREQETTLTGQALMNEFELRIPQRRASLLVRYRPE